MKAVMFAVVFIALYVGHEIGDLWVQTHSQATVKGTPGWAGRFACVRHVATLTATMAVTLTAAVMVTGVHLNMLLVIAGLAVNAGSHYIADRRKPLAWIADVLGASIIPGKGTFYRLGQPRPGQDDNPTLGTGAYHLDQSWHIGWVFITALIIIL